MPITKGPNGELVESLSKDFDQFKKTGVHRDDQFAICDEYDRLKQLQFQTRSQASDTTVTLKSGASTTNIEVTLPAETGVLLTDTSLGSFKIIQTPTGTSPTATGIADTLTFTSNDGTVIMTGDAVTDTIDFSAVANAASVTVGSTTTLTPGSPATVVNSGTSANAILDFGIPQGAVGPTGPTGPTGATGTAATIAAGTTTTSAPGGSASVTNSGTSSAAIFDFTIPRGDIGPQGPASLPPESIISGTLDNGWVDGSYGTTVVFPDATNSYSGVPGFSATINGAFDAILVTNATVHNARDVSYLTFYLKPQTTGIPGGGSPADNVTRILGMRVATEYLGTVTQVSLIGAGIITPALSPGVWSLVKIPFSGLWATDLKFTAIYLQEYLGSAGVHLTLVSTELQQALPGPLYPHQGYSLIENWITAAVAGNNAWTSTVSGTGAANTVVTTAQTNRNRGIVQLSSGTTATGRAALSLGLSAQFYGGGSVYNDMLVYIPVLSGAVETFAFRAGTGDGITGADHVDGVYFEHSGALANWQLKTANNSTRTTTNSSIPVVAGAWTRLTITVDSTGALASYYVNGVLAGTISTNIPVTAGRVCGPAITLVKSVGLTARTVLVDYYALSTTFTTYW